MKKDLIAEIVGEIARATQQPENIVLEAYTQATSSLKRDARIMDFVPLFAAKRVKESLKSAAID